MGEGNAPRGIPALCCKQLWSPDCTLKSIGLGWACVARISQALTVSCEGAVQALGSQRSTIWVRLRASLQRKAVGRTLCSQPLCSGSSGKESACNAGAPGDACLICGSGKIPWRREWQPIPVFMPGESHGQGAWWKPFMGSQSITVKIMINSAFTEHFLYARTVVNTLYIVTWDAHRHSMKQMYHSIICILLCINLFTY